MNRRRIKSKWHLPACRTGFPLPSIVNRLLLLSHQSWIDVPWSSAIRNIAGDIAEGANLFAGRTSIRDGIGPKRETAI